MAGHAGRHRSWRHSAAAGQPGALLRPPTACCPPPTAPALQRVLVKDEAADMQAELKQIADDLPLVGAA